MEGERSTIVQLFKQGKKPGAILKILNMPKTRRKFVYRTIKRFQDTNSVKDKPRSGRPVSVTKTKMKKVVWSRILRNPRRSIRKMAAQLKMSPKSLRTIVRRGLGLSSYKRRKVHLISTLVREKKLSRSKGLLKRFANFGLDQVLFFDEKLFTVEEVSNSQNDRILSQFLSTIPDKFRYVKRVQKPLSVMVWAGVSAVGRTPLVFVPPGVKINALTYQDLILKPFVKDLERTMFNNKPFLFQQDGAPAHTAKSTQEWLRTEIPSYISKLEWPPSSPDLNPLDFSLWSILESRACSNSHRNLEGLRKTLCREWDLIPQ